MQPCKTGDQLYSDASPNGECSLVVFTPWRITQQKTVIGAMKKKLLSSQMADLLLILFGFSCFAYAEWTTVLLLLSNPNQSNRRSAVQ